MAKDKIIAISGASGFIGSYLTNYFESQGSKVIQLNRTHFEPHHEKQLELLLANADVIINLAGAPINKRWTSKYKLELIDSRINTTRSLVKAVNNQKNKPKVFISASAVGYYSTLHSYDEYISRKADNFLGNLCDSWEKETKKVSKDIRLVIIRLGVVLAPVGGAFGILSRPSKMKLSTIIGPGSQPFNWIDIKDVANITDQIIQDESYKDVINLVAPNRITNKEFTAKTAKYYHSFATIKIPKLFFKILFGEASQFMCEGQRVKPTKLLEAGYKFESKTLEEFLEKI